MSVARPLFLDVVDLDFPEDGPIADALEALVAGTLPAIPGLCEDMSADERAQVMSTTIASQRVAFIAMHGDLFGQTVDAVATAPAGAMPAPTAAMQAAP